MTTSATSSIIAMNNGSEDVSGKNVKVDDMNNIKDCKGTPKGHGKDTKDGDTSVGTTTSYPKISY